MMGRSTTGSNSLGTLLVAGSILVPKPAAGMIAFLIFRNIISPGMIWGWGYADPERVRGCPGSGRYGPAARLAMGSGGGSETAKRVLISAGTKLCIARS